MTITYPRSLPSNTRMSECWFDLIDNIAIAPSAKGNFVNLSQTNDPVWQGNFVTGVNERDVRPVWSAWRKSLRGGLKFFVAYDIRHSAPLAYPSAKVPGDISGSWNGLATVAVISGSLLQLAGLPSTYQFKAGDRIGLEQASHYGYYEILEDVTATAGTVTVNVAPFLHSSYFNTSAVCRVWRPVCQFIIDQNSWSEQGTVENTPVAFKGFQRI